MKINELLKELSEFRPLFHNELDFQFHFAWLLKEKGYVIRPEHYIGSENGIRKYIDLVAIDEEKNICYLFEFKYKTRNVREVINNEIYDLFNQGARDLGSYAVLKDVQRLEGQINNNICGVKVKRGYVIFLTNDEGYKNGFKKGSLCHNYGLQDNVTLLANNPIKFILPKGKNKEDTCVRYLEEIVLKKEYLIKWDKYSKYLNMLIIEI